MAKLPTASVDPSVDKAGFTFKEEEELNPKIVLTIFGGKGTGKTSLAFTAPGNLSCMSYDKKSAIIKKEQFDDDSRIKVYDAVKFYKYDKEEITASAFKSYDFMMYLLDEIKKEGNTDWIIHDGYEIIAKICEMKMRYENNIGPFQGVANLNLWKGRRLDIRRLHNKSLEAANKGVIYTTYTDKDEVVIDGTLMCRKDVPKYTDVIMWETDIVIKTFAERASDELIHLAEVVTSKLSKKIPEITHEVQNEKAFALFKPLA